MTFVPDVFQNFSETRSCLPHGAPVPSSHESRQLPLLGGRRLRANPRHMHTITKHPFRYWLQVCNRSSCTSSGQSLKIFQASHHRLQHYGHLHSRFATPPCYYYSYHSINACTARLSNDATISTFSVGEQIICLNSIMSQCPITKVRQICRCPFT